MTSIFGAVLRKARRGVAVYGEELARKRLSACMCYHTTQFPMFEKNTRRQSRFSNETMTIAEESQSDVGG